MRITALIAAFVGAVGSVVLTLDVGYRNPSRVLMAVFVVWVLSPFAALIRAHSAAPRWPEVKRTALYIVMFVVALGSLAIYGTVAFGPPMSKPASVFLLVPPASGLVAAVALAIAARIGGGQRGRQF